MASRITNYDALFCGNLSISHTNAIQSHGVLLVVDKEDGKILQVSENIHHLLSVEFDSVINRSLSEFVTENSYREILKQSAKYTLDRNFVLQVEFNNKSSFVKYFTSITLTNRTLFIEVNFIDKIEQGRKNDLELFQKINEVISALEVANSPSEACNIAASEIKKISGFDKVMIYEFDEEWHGTVVAQSMEPGMDDYLGLKFPASDIPKPVRDLYFTNPVRSIPNRDYVSVPLYPEINTVTGEQTDLSKSNLRTVAGVHLEYLKNMGIIATLSTRIIYHDTLWGLISCSHRTPKHLTFEETLMFELLSNIVSSKISSLINLEKNRLKGERNEQTAYLINQVKLVNDITEGLRLSSDVLLRFLNAEGCVVKWNDRIVKAGATPDDLQIAELINWLTEKRLTTTIQIPALSEVFNEAAAYTGVASGIMVLPLLTEAGNFIVSFRPEVVKKVSWGGNPNEAVNFEPDSTVYHPRNSFNTWRQTIKNTALPWNVQEVEAAETFRVALVEFALHRKNTNLHKLLEEFEFVTNFIPQIIWSTKPDGSLDYFNRQWFEYTGCRSEVTKGTEWMNYIHQDDSEKAQEIWHYSLKNQTPYQTEVRIKGCDGTYKWFLARAVPLKDTEGKIVKWYGSWTDINDQKLMSELLEEKVESRTRELRNSNIVLEQTNNELTQFIKVASHDLQEPIRKIQVFGNTIKDRFLKDDKSELENYLSKIISSSNRVKLLLGDLLQFLNIPRKGAFSKTDITEVVNSVLSEMELILNEKDASVVIRGLTVIDAITEQIHQAFYNLISNSVKFSRPGVPLKISITGEKVNGLAFDAQPDEGGEFLRLTVADNGIGFNQAYSEVIFRLFQRLHKNNESEGTGIGLAIINKVVEIHGGIITARAKENEGAEFIIVLPVVQVF